MFATRLIAAALAMGITAALAADDWDFAAPHKRRCSTGTMLDMNLCLHQEYRKTEGRLTQLYQSLLKSLQDAGHFAKRKQLGFNFVTKTARTRYLGLINKRVFIRSQRMRV